MGPSRSELRPSSATLEDDPGPDSHGRVPEEGGSGVPVPSVGRLLLTAFQLFEDRIVDGIRSLGFSDFRLSDTYVFRNLDPEGSRITTLASRARVTKQSMSEFVRGLEHRGYVERRPDPRDGRAKRVHLTDRGRSLNEAARRVHRELVEEWAEALGAPQFGRLRALLGELLAAHGALPSFVDPLDR